MREPRALVGIIGGSGLYKMEGLTGVREVKVPTPFGDPSDAFLLGSVAGVPLAFLPRHGTGHRILPSEINFRANIYAMKLLGVERIISVSAVGSMREGIAPGHLVIPDQFYDRTRHRAGTFFGEGIAAHVGLADPVCADLAGALGDAGEATGSTIHRGGTYLCIEGPQFSTRAESRIYRQWGVDVIGMTNLPEARLAREAEICYATVALATDYDCWHAGEEDVTVEGVVQTLRQNVERAKTLIREAVPRLGVRKCRCGEALKDAILTDTAAIPFETRRRLAAIVGKYLPET